MHFLLAKTEVCLEAFALIFVPSSATCLSDTSPDFQQTVRTCANSAAKLLQVPAAKLGYSSERWRVARPENSKRYILLQGAFRSSWRNELQRIRRIAGPLPSSSGGKADSLSPLAHRLARWPRGPADRRDRLRSTPDVPPEASP